MQKQLKHTSFQQSLVSTAKLANAFPFRQVRKQSHSIQTTAAGSAPQSQKLQQQHSAPEHGLPAKQRQPLRPAAPLQPRTVDPDVSASDRTLNVIVRVSAFSANIEN